MARPACESFERLLGISTKPTDLDTAFAIRQVDFDPQPCPSTYRIDASPTSTVDLHWSSASRYSSHQLDRSSKETPPLSGSSTSFDLIDNDSPRCLKGFATRFRDSLNSGTLALHWTDHRPGMSPYSLSTDDHRYRDNNKQWDDTNAESNAEIRSALMDSLQELKDIEGVWHEDGFELQRTCHQWEVTFSKVVNQVIDFYVSLFASCFTGDNCLTSLTTTQKATWLELETRHLALQVCTACLALKVPYKGIWDACERVREILSPKEQYQDDYFGVELDSSDTDGHSHVTYGSQTHSTQQRVADHYDGSLNAQQYHLDSSGDRVVQKSSSYSRHDPLVNVTSRVSMDTDDLIFDCDA